MSNNRGDLSAKVTILFARLALGVGFLSAVADRFGVWGAPGARNVAWGTFERFLAYTARINPLAPPSWIPLLGWTATIAEIVLGTLLIVGFRTRIVAFASGCLLLLFALAMSTSTGVKTALGSSVFSAAACAFLLAHVTGARR